MRVTFRRTGERRYGAFVERENAPTVGMHPAPGYDEFLPHDLLHFVAEAEWGIDGAVFGPLAIHDRHGRRRKRPRKSRPRGRRSELLAAVLEQAWNARHGRGSLPEDWAAQLAAARVEPQRLEEVVASLDGLAERWHALRIGESITLEWPRPERPAPHAPRLPERRSAPRARRG